MADLVNILASNCIVSGGAMIARGTFSVTPTDKNNQPIPVRVGASGPQVLAQAALVPVLNGSIVGTLQFPNRLTSDPLNVFAKIKITDTSTNTATTTTYTGVVITPDANGNWDFAKMDTSLVTASLPVALVVGPPGPTATPRGNYDPAVTYAIGDLVASTGGSYVSLQASNTGNTPASSPTWWMTSAQQGPAGISGIQYPTLSAASADIYARLGLSQPVNLFDPTKGSCGYYDGGGNFNPNSGPYWTTAPFPVFGQNHIILNVGTIAGSYLRWLNPDGSVLSLTAAGQAPQTAIAVPVNATACMLTVAANPTQIGGQQVAPTGVMIEAGTISHAYAAYALALPETTNLARESTAINTSVSALAAFLAEKTGSPFVNLLDYGKVVYGVIDASNGATDGQYNPEYSIATLYVLGLSTFVATFDIGVGNTGFTTLFLAADGATIVESRPGVVYAAGTPVPVNPAATYARIFGLTGQMAALQNAMVIAGSTMAPSFVAYNTPLNPMQGKRGFIAGDSICGYQNAAWPRKMASLLQLAQTLGGTATYPAAAFTTIGAQRGAYAAGTTYAAGDLVYFTDGLYYVSLVTPNVGNAPAASPAKWVNFALTSDVISFPGHPVEDCFLSFDANAAANPSGPTTTQQLTAALANKDFFILAAGTNNYTQPLGSFADAPVDGNSATNPGGAGAPTFYAALWFKVNLADAAILATGRTIVPCFSTPYHNSRGTSAALLAQINAIHAVCAERGWVCIDNYSGLAINSVNWTRTLVGESDGAGGTMQLHPNPVGVSLLGNFHARALIANAQV